MSVLKRRFERWEDDANRAKASRRLTGTLKDRAETTRVDMSSFLPLSSDTNFANVWFSPKLDSKPINVVSSVSAATTPISSRLIILAMKP